ncbi:MAG: hypothetical protein ACT4P7_21205, partial [Gemmatimonadaceae bacterium]
LGFTVPSFDLLWRNLFDPRYGLFVFCPLLLLAMAAPFSRRPAATVLTKPEMCWALAGGAGLLLFSSANQFANLQWNTGVRYLVPLVPLLFFAALPVLRAMPNVVRIGLVGVSVVISLAVSMTRESVTDALTIVFTRGPTLPVFIVLEKMASGYPALQFGALGPLVALGGAALTLYLLWRPERSRRSARA